MNENYTDILQLPHYRSKKHPPMSMEDRAAQFSPFAALTGFETVIREAARLTIPRMEISEYEKGRLDQALVQLQKLLPNQPEAEVTYFVSDVRKSGGKYSTVRGNVIKLDLYKQILLLADGTRIPIPDIVRILSDCFPEI